MIKPIRSGIIVLCMLCQAFCFRAAAQSTEAAQWIVPSTSKDEPNSWLAYRKVVSLSEKPTQTITKIAADSKYWLWINEKLVVFEGGLKRGPDPDNTYYDEINLAPYLLKGKNTIAVLVWYFGKEGFSHKSSGKAGLYIESQAPSLNSNKTWKTEQLKAYQTAAAPVPNYRLPESSILYDASKELGNWQGREFNDTSMQPARELGTYGTSPWNKLVKRPIPLFKDFGLKNYTKAPKMPFVSKGDTIVCNLPYNAQITPYFKIEGAAGQKITMYTDNYLLFLGGEVNLRAEYITKDGIQEYESLGWINGHKAYYVIPKGVKVTALKYRETGYDTEFSGSFTSSSAFLNKLWHKAQRTLYLNMRDSYMDCPERERAQWTADAVNESGQAFYALSKSSTAMSRKWLHELVAWQKKDSSLFSPSPAGNWDKELPDQSMASVGYYGLWNYYLHSGDKQTLKDVYDAAKRYVAAWKLNEKGTIIFRPGGWTWGDWGDNRDMLLLYNLWYYMGLKGMQLTADELGKSTDAEYYRQLMQRFKTSFNAQFWNGNSYRDPDYKGKTDDRTQALAVLADVADAEKYPAILKIFQTEEHASPYMEKYVFEAMFAMGYEKEALARHEKRFTPMVMNSKFTTLFEVWNIDSNGVGGGTINHAWSGGGLTILSQYLSGVSPITPGYKQFSVKPQPGDVSSFKTLVPSVAGDIKVSWNNQVASATLEVTVPKGTEAMATMPKGSYDHILLNSKKVWSKQDNGKPQMFRLTAGSWTLKGIKISNY
ncbi:alpha-L-rhamnosidase-related protein [Pedobacter psychroterrae]|nr:alpha-L-rhamnosidase C-terminal domain-containing protein [Pedobacter psychroterrae]